MTLRPSWTEIVGGAGASSPIGSIEGLPGEGWPPLETVDYALKLITLIVLLLALPWLFSKIISEPGKVSRHAASLVGNPSD